MQGVLKDYNNLKKCTPNCTSILMSNNSMNTCDTTHTMQMHATQCRHRSGCDTAHTTCMPLKTNTTHSKMGFSMPRRAHATSHTPHVCNPQQTQPTQGWVLDAKSACNITHTTRMQLTTDTTHSKVGSRCQEGMQHHTHHMHATQDSGLHTCGVCDVACPLGIENPSLSGLCLS